MSPFLIAAAAAAAAAPALATAPAGPPRKIDVELIASTTAPKRGSTILIGFRMTPKPGWHGYWSNPGGSGIAPSVQWSAPPGVHFGPLLHPAPTLLQSMGLVSYVHSGPHILVSRMTVDDGVAPGTPIPIAAELNWAACSKNLCVPQHASFSLRLAEGDGAASSNATALKRAVEELPRSIRAGTFSTSGKKLVLQLPQGARLNFPTVRFFPDRNGFYDSMDAHPEAGEPPRIVTRLNGLAPDEITGVLSDGSNSYRVTFRRDLTTVAAPRPERVAIIPKDEPVAPSAKEEPATLSDADIESPPEAPVLPRLIRTFVLLGIAAFGVFAITLARRPYR